MAKRDLGFNVYVASLTLSTFSLITGVFSRESKELPSQEVYSGPRARLMPVQPLVDVVSKCETNLTDIIAALQGSDIPSAEKSARALSSLIEVDSFVARIEALVPNDFIGPESQEDLVEICRCVRSAREFFSKSHPEIVDQLDDNPEALAAFDLLRRAAGSCVMFRRANTYATDITTVTVEGVAK